MLIKKKTIKKRIDHSIDSKKTNITTIIKGTITAIAITTISKIRT